MNEKQLTDMIAVLVGEKNLGPDDRGRIEAALAAALRREVPERSRASEYLLGAFDGHPELAHVAWRLEEALRAGNPFGEVVLSGPEARDLSAGPEVTVLNASGASDPRMVAAVAQTARETAAGAAPGDPPVVILANDLAARERAVLLLGLLGPEGAEPGANPGDSGGQLGG